jgi:asparagine synthase (glutamine-hydrolysing)
MCGILGQVTLDKKLTYDCSRFNSALELLEHRGPDDFGIIEDEKFIFGHRRLSIIDLSTDAKQPMLTSDTNVCVTFNGEIYNYLEIKDTLISKGYCFRTNSDTEVLLYSYYEWGIDCVHKFIGMFAFAIFDKRRNEAYIVRDRLGIKPLYYTINNNHLTFSSEVKSILLLDKKSRKLNLTAVSSYLSFRYPILNDTFFDDVKSLAPGHIINIKSNHVEIKEYWNLKDYIIGQENDMGEEFYINRLRELLLSSVKYRMISDVSIGAFLSGGVDSSIVAALMAQKSVNPVKTFTIGFGEDGYNEYEYANLIVNKFKTEHHEICLKGDDYFKVMEQLISFKDAPLSVPNEVPLYLMSKELKKYITVVLSGEGADELFGGYGRIFRSPFDYERLKSIEELNYSEEEKKQFLANFENKYHTISFKNELDHFIAIYSYSSLNEKKYFLRDDIDVEKIEEKFKDKFQHTFEEVTNSTYNNKLLYTFEKIHLQGLLNRVDITTMAASVEARVPFVDHRLVEFAFSIPIKYKLKWKSNEHKFHSKLFMSDEISEIHDCPKYILKKAYEDIIPHKVLYRKKIGFPVPLNNWLGGRFNNLAKEILLDEKVKKQNIFNTRNIEKYLNCDMKNSQNNMGLKIWMLLNFQLFNEKYFN